MIKNVDLLEIKKYSYWNLIELTITIGIMPCILIFTSTLSSNSSNISFFIFIVFVSIFILIKFIYDKKKNLFTYILMFILTLMIFIPSIDNINYFKIVVFIFSLLFFWVNANIFLKEIKNFLFSRFIIKNKIKLYTPIDNISKGVFNNYWSPIDPFKIKFIDSNNNLIKEDKNTYFSIRRSPSFNIKNAFLPIYDLICCQILLKNSNDRQKYFNTMYITLIIINFIYFFTSLFITKVLISLSISNEFIYLFMALTIIINLSFTIYLFIKHLKINKCDENLILSRLQNNILIDDSIFSIDRHYLTLNNRTRFIHNKAIDNLEDINNKLINKLESIYQIATPILFLSQITLSIALINSFTKGSPC